MWMEEIGYDHNSKKHCHVEVLHHGILEWRRTRRGVMEWRWMKAWHLHLPQPVDQD